MASIELAAWAKVNLFLKVLEKRKDSYHNILTLFERISLCDTVRLTKTQGGVKVLSDCAITQDPRDNLAYKAARLLLDHKDVDGGVRIYIKKRIPMAAGLGGGSSDAAAVLAGLNRLYKLGLDRRELMTLGGRLGADVPFFLMDEPFAIGRSAGDRLSKADIGLKPWHLLIYPGPFKASTREVYAYFDASPKRPTSRHGSGSNTGPLSKHLTSHIGGARITLPKNWMGLEAMLYNDLGDVVAGTRPVIGKTIQCLVASLGKKFIVSGSGPSVFCLYRTRKEALGAKRRLFGIVKAERRRLWKVFIVQTKV